MPSACDGRLRRATSRRLHVRELGLEHRPDLLGTLERLDVPGEGDEVAPEAVVAEQLRGGDGVAGGQRLLEAPEPLGDLSGSGLDDGLGHALLQAGDRRPHSCPTGRQEGPLVADHTDVDWLLRSRLGSHLFLIAGSAAVPAAALHALTRGGEAPVSGVGHLVDHGRRLVHRRVRVASPSRSPASAGRDGRSLISGGAFGAMTLLLVIHGLATPGRLPRPQRDHRPRRRRRAARRRRDARARGAPRAAAHGQPAGAGARRRRAPGLIAAAGIAAFANPSIVPKLPRPGSPRRRRLPRRRPRFYLVVALRAVRTFTLTRRASDLVVVVGVTWLGFALVPVAAAAARLLAWWTGHTSSCSASRSSACRSRSTSVAAAVAPARRRPPRRGARRLPGGVPRSARARAHAAPGGEGPLDRGAHAPRRGARGAGSATSSASPPGACASSRSAGCCTTWASSRCPTRSSASRARWTTRSSRHPPPSRRRRRAARRASASPPASAAMVAATTSAWTAAATPTRSPAPSSTSRPASSPSPTSTTRSSPPASTAPPGRRARARRCCATRPAWLRPALRRRVGAPRRRRRARAAPRCLTALSLASGAA